jgi:hypothetical protein
VPQFGKPEQFQKKCAAILHPELRENKNVERLRDSVKNGNAPRLFSSRDGDRVNFLIALFYIDPVQLRRNAT